MPEFITDLLVRIVSIAYNTLEFLTGNSISGYELAEVRVRVPNLKALAALNQLRRLPPSGLNCD